MSAGGVPPPPSALPDFSSLGLSKPPTLSSTPTVNPFAPRSPRQTSTVPDPSSLPKPSTLPDPVSLSRPGGPSAADSKRLSKSPSPSPVQSTVLQQPPTVNTVLAETIARNEGHDKPKPSPILSPISAPTLSHPPPQIDAVVSASAPVATVTNTSSTVSPKPVTTVSSGDRKPEKVSVQPVSSGISSIEQSLTQLEQSENEGMFGWFTKTVADSKFLSQVAEKAKSSMDTVLSVSSVGMETVLTTLDPGMKEFLSGEGVVELYVGTEDPMYTSSIRQGFERVFAQVVVRGIPVPQADLPPLCLGLSSAHTLSSTRATRLSASRLASPNSPFVVMQPFVMEIEKRWFSSTHLLLRWKGEDVDAITQPLPIEDKLREFIEKRQSSENKKNGTFPLTIVQAAKELYEESESWNGGCLPYGFSEFLSPSTSVLASEFRRIVKKEAEKGEETKK